MKRFSPIPRLYQSDMMLWEAFSHKTTLNDVNPLDPISMSTNNIEALFDPLLTDDDRHFYIKLQYIDGPTDVILPYCGYRNSTSHGSYKSQGRMIAFFIPLAIIAWDVFDTYMSSHFFHTLVDFNHLSDNSVCFRRWLRLRTESTTSSSSVNHIVNDNDKNLTLPFLMAISAVRLSKGLGICHRLKDIWNVKNPNFFNDFGASCQSFSPNGLINVLDKISIETVVNHPATNCDELLPIAIDSIRVFYNEPDLDISPCVLVLLYRLLNYHRCSE